MVASIGADLVYHTSPAPASPLTPLASPSPHGFGNEPSSGSHLTHVTSTPDPLGIPAPIDPVAPEPLLQS